MQECSTATCSARRLDVMVETLEHRNFSVLGSGRLLMFLLISAMLGSVSIAANAQTRAMWPPDWEPKLAVLHSAGNGLIPLFVLGDVNEDGQVDEQDLELVRSIVQAGNQTQLPAAISCLAAGDVDQNGRIDQRDLDTLTEWVSKKVTAPALSYQAALSCDFKRFILAASPYARRGGAARIRFLDAALNAANTMVSIEEGEAVIGIAADDRGYEAIVRDAAKVGDQIVLKIILPDKRIYYYSFFVEDAPESLSPEDTQK
jgi:hypothetical protein